jgi:tetratricopeptide (TPR) repeat protein
MLGYERSDDLETAGSVADEIIRLDPNSVRHHQKRVEYAFRTNDKPRLVEAYLQLADSLFKSGQEDKSRAVYQRVLDLAPDDIRAQAALTAFPEEAAPAPPPKKEAKKEKPGAAPPPKRYTAEMKRTSIAAEKPAEPAAERPDDAFVNLGDWLRDDAPKDTRMVVEEKEPTGDEQADFADMLKKFKQGVAENVDAEDYQSHYDLAIAFKEMGLLDEAIAGFQKALGSKTNRLPTYEALGECFLEKGQSKMAAAILNRALTEVETSDDHLVGVLYLLGRAAEEQGQGQQALEFYQRVFVIDIQFKDVADRMSALDQAAR